MTSLKFFLFTRSFLVFFDSRAAVTESDPWSSSPFKQSFIFCIVTSYIVTVAAGFWVRSLFFLPTCLYSHPSLALARRFWGLCFSSSSGSRRCLTTKVPNDISWILCWKSAWWKQFHRMFRKYVKFIKLWPIIQHCRAQKVGWLGGLVVSIAACSPRGREFDAPLWSSFPVRRNGLSS